MNRIKEVLDEKGIKQTWLTEKLDKSYNTVNSYVQNRRQPSIEDLYKIAEILNVSVTDLLIDNQIKNSPSSEGWRKFKEFLTGWFQTAFHKKIRRNFLRIYIINNFVF